MGIPAFQTLMLPLLRCLADGEPRSLSSIVDLLAFQFKLDATDLAKRLPIGGQLLLPNRVRWARTYMVKAGLLEVPAQGVIKITSAQT